MLFIFTLFQYNILDSALKETSYLDLMQLSFFFLKKTLVDISLLSLLSETMRSR